MNVIQDWIQNHSHRYVQGLDLLERFGKNGRMVEALRKRQNRDKVIYELRKLARLPNLPKPDEIELSREDLMRQVKELTRHIDKNARISGISTPKAARSKPLPLPNDRILDKSEPYYPESIRKAIQERSRLANRRDKLSNSLITLDSDTERKKVRTEISTLHKRIQDYNDVVGKWEREQKITEVAPDPEPVNTLSKEERKALMRDLRNARANRSKKADRLQQWKHNTEAAEYKRVIQIDKYTREFEGWDLRCKALQEQLGI